MTSRPLFIIDAESMVIFRPMLQFGCFKACSSVACSISAGAQVRNGPPDAVMMTRASSSRLPEESAGADEAFLDGEGHRGTTIDGGERRLQSGRAAHRSHHPIGRTRGGLDD